MSNIKYVSEKDFEQIVLKSDKPVVVDFWATWCGPCKAIAPILDEISNEREDVIIAKLDVDENPQIASKYRIRGIPTMNLFHKGEVIASKVGAVNKSAIMSWIDSNI